MKRVFEKIENIIILIAMVIFGVLLIAIPQHIVRVVPYVIGVGLILFGCFNLVMIFRSGDKEAKPGRQLLFLVVGLVSLLQRNGALATIGVLWAILTLLDCAEEINEFYETREIHPFAIFWMLVEIVLSVMLMHDPMEHFVFHMRILGAEFIVHSILRYKAMQKA